MLPCNTLDNYATALTTVILATVVDVKDSIDRGVIISIAIPFEEYFSTAAKSDKPTDDDGDEKYPDAFWLKIKMCIVAVEDTVELEVDIENVEIELFEGCTVD